MPVQFICSQMALSVYKKIRLANCGRQIVNLSFYYICYFIIEVISAAVCTLQVIYELPLKKCKEAIKMASDRQLWNSTGYQFQNFI